MDCVDTARLGHVIRSQMPPTPRAGWEMILSGAVNDRRSDTQLAEQAADWVARNGPERGYRPSKTTERARGIGCAAYQLSLGLAVAQLYDGQGNHFDPDFLRLGIAAAIRAWLAGGSVTRVFFPTSFEVL